VNVYKSCQLGFLVVITCGTKVRPTSMEKGHWLDFTHILKTPKC